MSEIYLDKYQYIKKRTSDPDGLDFESLRKEGIRLVQDLSGDIWTDYNTHDPGVTILEQLCYALTDLAYRAGFEVKDFLTDKNGRIDFERLALFLPQDILTTNPITIKDYRKILFDSITGTYNIWIEKDTRNRYNGLYTIYVNTRNSFDKKREPELINQIKKVYSENRNLCEDIEKVCIAQKKDFILNAEIEVNNDINPADILAKIYFECTIYLSQAMRHYSYEETIKKGIRIEDIFTGPFTKHGYINDKELKDKPDPDSIHLSEITRIIKNISGVESIHALSMNPQKNIENNNPDLIPHLFIPKTDEDINVRLINNGKKLDIRFKEFSPVLKKYFSDYHGLRHTKQDVSLLCPLPCGNFRNFKDYFSIQHQFPAIYGINSLGLPNSQTPQRKAQAKQLKGYLLIFEQIMADFLANLQNLPNIFSTDQKIQKTFFTQPVTDKNAPDVNALYNVQETELGMQLENITKKYDNYYNRKNRVLDYILALYGIKYPESIIRNFKYYWHGHGIEKKLIKTKTELLKNLVKTGQKNGGAFNYQNPSWNTENMSGLRRITAIFLGMPYYKKISLTSVITAYGLKLLSDEKFLTYEYLTEKLKFAEIDTILLQDGHRIAYDNRIKDVSRKDTKHILNKIFPLKKNIIYESFLKNGIDLNNYRIVKPDSKRFLLVFRPDKKTQYSYLASFPDKNEAAKTANLLCLFLLKLNFLSEGFHITEHILLRPTFVKKYKTEDDEFYSFKMSVILPLWTARFSDERFRDVTEDTIRSMTPAHIYIQFIWLNFDDMLIFETIFKKWRHEKIKKIEKNETLDEYSEEIINFLCTKSQK